MQTATYFNICGDTQQKQVDSLLNQCPGGEGEGWASGCWVLTARLNHNNQKLTMLLMAKSHVRLKAGHPLKISPQMKNILIQKKTPKPADDCGVLKTPMQTLSQLLSNKPTPHTTNRSQHIW